ncbi:MAG: orotidine-5'-phosphate decarboxylase, partial [Spirochaetales bacterium]
CSCRYNGRRATVSSLEFIYVGTRHTDSGIFEAIHRRSTEKDTLLCVGLEPRVEPSPRAREEIIAESRRIIDATAAHAVAFKPTLAFYEVHGAPGLEALKETIEAIPDDIPVILDGKRANSAEAGFAEARMAVETLGAKAVTVSPYLGTPAVKPILDHRNVCAFVVCRTASDSRGEYQDLELSETGEPLFLHVADTMLDLSLRVGLVVDAADGVALRALRSRFPGRWFLAPEVGGAFASAGDAVRNGADSDGGRILPVAVTAIRDRDDPETAARALREEIARARKSVSKRGTLPPSRYSRASAQAEVSQARNGSKASGSQNSLKGRLVSALFEKGCFQTGHFRLRAGGPSPFYIDLSRIAGDPLLLELSAQAYAGLAREIVFDKLAGLPVKALPLATALSLHMSLPLIYPRVPMKAHGSGHRVEGEFASGERALMVDDLISYGKSKLEAVEVLRAEGLEVHDLIVLVQRGNKGEADLERLGVRLHSYVHVTELIEAGASDGYITEDERARIDAYLERES